MKYKFNKTFLYFIMAVVCISIIVVLYLSRTQKQEGLNFIFDHDSVYNVTYNPNNWAGNTSVSSTNPGNGDQSLTAIINTPKQTTTSTDKNVVDKNKLPAKDIFYSIQWLINYQI
jgi:hypothetical protein